ncbi:MAG: hypothetical protein IJC04_05945 [Oscillospiraceae bacterium]|nr:hypothetical protein [Oscillospiraceae bacterium]
MARSKKKVSAFAVVEIIFIAILVLVMVAMLAFNFLFKKNNTAATVLGYSFYNTKAVNMLPDFPENTVVIAKESEIANIVEGSVILCNIGDFTTLIRVTQIQQEADKTYYVVKFDTSSANETFRIESDAVIAKAVWQINGFGKFLDFATSTVGIIIAVVIPLIFIISIQVARILSIRKLEDEADALDDIDDIIQSRNDKEPAPVTFTEPKFVEDVTGKIPVIHREPEPKPEKILSVDNKGRAEYIERKQEPQDNSPLFSYENLRKSQQTREPVAAGVAHTVTEDDVYINRPTRINPEMKKTNEFLEKYAPQKSENDNFAANKSESVVFTPHLSNIIPESIAAVQEETSAPKKSGFDNSVKAYFDRKTEISPEQEKPQEEALIPEQAVVPKETIAPPKKKKNNKALAELMSIIDAEETKLKK